MDTIKKFFPHAFKATELKPFVITLIIYILIDFVCGLLIGLVTTILAIIPIVGAILGWLLGIVGSLVGIYALVGIVLSILVFAKVIK